MDTKKTGKINRVKWDYFKEVKIPEEFKIYLWDYEEKAPVEILVLRVLKYGNFDEIKKIYNLFPEETYKIAFKYHQIKRGVKFWIKRWKNYSN
ncbi:hypothetical protein J7K25_04040 [bacterium]|nr:hypothetical protein [bacterium]